MVETPNHSIGDLGHDSSHESPPIFIFTPFIGQGDILNEEWINGRIALLEAVTLNCLLGLLEEGVHWVIFLGANPLPKVEDYAHSLFDSNPRISVLKERHSSDNISKFCRVNSESEQYVTMIIADDDAWPKDYISTIRNTINKLVAKGTHHFGASYANGLEWVMCDQVDIDFINKSDFRIIRKRNLFEYRFPWIGAGFFVLQTKSRPFEYMTVAHPTIPQYLEKSGFESIVLEEPKRAWLYNRHQFADSGIVKSESEPLKFSHEDLETEFGIDSKLISSWPTSSYNNLYFEKHAQGAGMLEMYIFNDTSDFVTMPYKYIFMESDRFIINLKLEFNISGEVRFRIYNETLKEYFLLVELFSNEQTTLVFHSSIFISEHNYKFDIQIMKDSKWTRVMPYIPMRFKNYKYKPDRFDGLFETKNMTNAFDKVGDYQIEYHNIERTKMLNRISIKKPIDIEYFRLASPEN